MFDWLFGDGGKQRQQLANQQAQANDIYGQYNKWYGGLSDTDRKSVNDQFGGDFMGTLKNNGLGIDQINKTASEYDKQHRYDYFGDGALGSILNPIGQTASAVKDLATGQYDKRGRDVASDIGAGVESALSLVPLAGGALKAAKLGGAAEKFGAAINSVPAMALTGAGFGAAGAYRQGGQNTNMSDVLSNAGSSALFGAALPIAGKIGGNLLEGIGARKYNVPGAYNALVDSGINPYQSAMLAADPGRKALMGLGARSLVPRTMFGKAAVGGGLLYGGSRLLNSGGEQQPMNYNDYSSMAQDPYAQYGMGY